MEYCVLAAERNDFNSDYKPFVVKFEDLNNEIFKRVQEWMGQYKMMFLLS